MCKVNNKLDGLWCFEDVEAKKEETCIDCLILVKMIWFQIAKWSGGFALCAKLWNIGIYKKVCQRG